MAPTDPASGAEDPAGDPGATENLGTATSALCISTNGADAIGELVWHTSEALQSGVYFSTSPDGSYGSAGCAGRYEVDTIGIHDWSNYFLAAQSSWANTSVLTGKGICESASVDMEVYYQTPSMPGIWLYFGHFTDTGAWNAYNSSCTVGVRTLVDPALTVSKMRVAAKASLPVWGAPLAVPITAGTTQTNYWIL